MPKTITISNEVYAAIVARRKTKDESVDAILRLILADAGDADAVHRHQQPESEDAHLILDSEIDHKTE